VSTEANLSIRGAYLLTPDIYPDERGFFCSLYTDKTPGAESRYCISRSAKSVIRGFHVRRSIGEAKLVRCSAGSIYDVIVDLRRWSDTYMKWVSVNLDGVSQRSLYIPPGCAHAYQALEDDTDVTYRIYAEFDPSEDVLFAWNDPRLAIPWPLEPKIMTERDRNAPTLKELGL
jgi:dTDP-4-dehydrorhamnose 3,5-epimerase